MGKKAIGPVMLAERIGVPSATVYKVIAGIKQAIVEGNRVQLTGIGSFIPKILAERTFNMPPINGRPAQTVTKSRRRTLGFYVTDSCKEDLNAVSVEELLRRKRKNERPRN